VLRLGGGSRVDVDGVSEDESVLVEIFAHQGRLRGGQYGKVARDALKLITLARTRPGSKLVLAFTDEDAARCVTGKSWLAEALKTWGHRSCRLDDKVREGLHAAQVRQVMINADGGLVAPKAANGSAVSPTRRKACKWACFELGRSGVS